MPANQGSWEKTDAGWRVQIAGDYFMANGSYEFDGAQSSYDGDLEGDIYGIVASLGFPSWKDSAWLDLAYRFGDYGGNNSFDVETTEYMIRYRTTLWNSTVGVSFDYQNWDWKPPGRAYDQDFYLLNLDFGHAWHKAYDNGIDFGVKLDFGFGLGYAATSQAAAEDGFLFDGYAGGAGFFQYVLFQKKTKGIIFLEGGYKGVLYWTYSGGDTDSYYSEDQTELWTMAGPYLRTGLRLDF